MFEYTALAVALALAAAPSVSASAANENQMAGSHLNATAHTAHQLNTRAVWLQQEYIYSHNYERAKHGANALIWDDSLSASALAWANQCKYYQSRSGENLHAQTGGPTPATAVGWWNKEIIQYQPSSPVGSRWTQVVWKSTTHFGCANATCAPGIVYPAQYGVVSYFVCHYSPAGNVIGQFPENVQK